MAFVLGQLTDGLAFLHARNIIHRDLKLENVLVAAARADAPLDPPYKYPPTMVSWTKPLQTQYLCSSIENQ